MSKRISFSVTDVAKLSREAKLLRTYSKKQAYYLICRTAELLDAATHDRLDLAAEATTPLRGVVSLLWKVHKHAKVQHRLRMEEEAILAQLAEEQAIEHAAQFAADE